MDEEPARILLFDGICNLCNAMVKFVIRHDTDAKIKFASLQSPNGQAILARHNLGKDQFDSFVYVLNGKIYLKSTAVLRVLRDLGGGWRLFFVFAAIPRFLRDPLYDVVSKVRYRIFGRRESCMVPSPDIQSRFLG
jgi:predicted DCC family thiol-disulfide oxidoreductase YuxK